MDIIYNYLSPRTQHFVNVIGSLFLFLFVGVLVLKGWEAAWNSMRIWERSYTGWAPPIWFVRFTIPIGCFLLLVQGVVTLIRDIAALAKKKEVS
jgi:TRAP-type mannitol/chloroaromatic compound transport system permease small subunit